MTHNVSILLSYIKLFLVIDYKLVKSLARVSMVPGNVRSGALSIGRHGKHPDRE